MPNDRDNADAADSADVGGLEPGAVINDSYKVVSLIGKGGMGAVYRVNQMMLGKDLAMKVLDLRRSSEVSARRFQQEAKTTAQLRHPNLVEVHDFGVYGTDKPYLVMDLVEGVSLSEVLKSKGALPINFVIELIIQVSFGLIYAHDKGVVHRDIKPGNIMLLHPDQPPAEGTVRIVDFGIAKLTQSEDGEIQALTKTGEIFGSPIYMSPEQCRGTAVDKRSDIFSLGCVMFECLTGSPPFFGDSAMSTMLMRLSDDIPSLKEASLGREFPEVLESIVRKMLAADPSQRYQDLGAVISDLMAMQSSDQGIAVSVAKKEKPSKIALPVINKILALVVVAFCASGATAIFDRAFFYRYYFLPTLDNPHASSAIPFSSSVSERKFRGLQQESDSIAESQEGVKNAADAMLKKIRAKRKAGKKHTDKSGVGGIINQLTAD